MGKNKKNNSKKWTWTPQKAEIEIDGVLFYSAGKIAEMMGLKERTVKDYIKNGILSAKKIGHTWYLTKDSIKEYLSNAPVKTKKKKDNA